MRVRDTLSLQCGMMGSSNNFVVEWVKNEDPVSADTKFYLDPTKPYILKILNTGMWNMHNLLL